MTYQDISRFEDSRSVLVTTPPTTAYRKKKVLQLPIVLQDQQDTCHAQNASCRPRFVRVFPCDLCIVAQRQELLIGSSRSILNCVSLYSTLFSWDTHGQQGTSNSNPYMRKKKSNQMDRSRSEGFGEPHWHVHGLLSNDNPRLHPNNRHYFSRPGLAAGYRQRGISR